MGIRLDSCLHESAHSIARQVLLGNLGEMGLKKRRAYSYPVNRRPLDEMTSEELAKIAVIVQAGIVAERTLCSSMGNESMKQYAISDDLDQLEGIQRIAGFSDEQMEGFAQEAAELVRHTRRPYARRPLNSTAEIGSTVSRSRGS